MQIAGDPLGPLTASDAQRRLQPASGGRRPLFSLSKSIQRMTDAIRNPDEMRSDVLVSLTPVPRCARIGLIVPF